MAVQYLQELMSIYKGTPMKLLMKKSDLKLCLLSSDCEIT